MKNWLWSAAALLALGGTARAAGRDVVQVQAPLDGAGAGGHETTLGDLVADAARQTAGADAAVIAADEITAAAIAPGAVPPERIVQGLRYAADPADTVIILSLKGAQLREAAERSVARAPQPFDGFLQVSGLQMRYDPAQPEGKRVTQVTVGGSPLEADHVYRVATTHSVADGSFGYFRFWTPADVTQDTHVTLAASLTGYLSAHKTIDVTLENRIAP